MKKLKFVFLMAVFMMVLVVTVTSSQVNTTKENPTTASIQASNGGAEYCWTVFSSTENTQIAVMLTVMPVNFVEVVKNGSDLMTSVVNKKQIEVANLSENQSKTMAADLYMQAGGVMWVSDYTMALVPTSTYMFAVAYDQAQTIATT